MKPTPKLRFVEREIKVQNDIKLVRILQQWWLQQHVANMGWSEIPMGAEEGEWRDVPLEIE